MRRRFELVPDPLGFCKSLHFLSMGDILTMLLVRLFEAMLAVILVLLSVSYRGLSSEWIQTLETSSHKEE